MPDDPTETDSWVGDDSAICDFCSSSDIRWRYPADTFSQELETTDGVKDAISIGDWAACDDCHKAIQMHDAGRLAEHVATTNPTIKDIEPEWVRNGITERLAILYEEFYAMAGMPYAYTPRRDA